MIKKVLFVFFVTIPILFDILLLFTHFSPSIIGGISLYNILTTEVFSVGFFITLVFFLMVIFYNLTSLRKQTNPFAKSILSLFSQHEFLITTACIMPLSTLGSVLLFMNFSGYIPTTLTFDLFPELYFIMKLGLIIVMGSTVAFFPQKYIRVGKIITSTLLCLLVVGLTIFYILFSQEGGPDFYGVFPLDDTKAVYILNYDGDYWVTYYHVSRLCTENKTGKVCKEVYEKLGNAPIAKSSVDLKPFIDKHITITGEFNKTMGLQEGNNKKLCIKDICEISPGPGQWVSSPITITSIKITNK